jgi:3-dehydroquinate dehydratase-1
MATARPVQLRGRLLGREGRPLVCTPLVAATADGVLSELAAVRAKGPDLVEWRADLFGDLGDRAAVVEVARRIRSAAPELPLLFTIRSSREGGHPVAISEEEVVALLAAVCDAGHVDAVDYELSNGAERVREVRARSRARGVALVLSFHDFARTPPADLLVVRFREAERLGADVAKVAVMPAAPEDVLTLLGATLSARRELTIPIISMSMGALGSPSRVVGWAFGSSVTFAVGQGASAPGQIPIEELRAALDVLCATAGERG